MDDLAAGRAVSVRVPASTANLGPGYDSVGMALGVWDECTATVTGDRLEIIIEGEGAAGLPCDESHLIHRSMVRAWRELGVPPPAGLRLECRNLIPHNRGLGSSAAAIVAGVALAHGLHVVSSGGGPVDGGGEVPVDLAAVNDLASELEGHPDNASASVYGGLTLSVPDDTSPGHTLTLRLAVHPDLVPVVAVPAAELSTATARAVLPATVPHAEAARNGARVGLLVEAVTRRPELLLAATRDYLHQEARRGSYAESMDLVDRLRAAGHAAVVSGAGPSVLVLATTAAVPQVMTVIDGSGWRALVPGIPETGVSVRQLGG